MRLSHCTWQTILRDWSTILPRDIEIRVSWSESLCADLSPSWTVAAPPNSWSYWDHTERKCAAVGYLQIAFRVYITIVHLHSHFFFPVLVNPLALAAMKVFVDCYSLFILCSRGSHRHSWNICTALATSSRTENTMSKWDLRTTSQNWYCASFLFSPLSRTLVNWSRKLESSWLAIFRITSSTTWSEWYQKFSLTM